ncbi:hypothetical protein EDEG_01887 [Edhazardia aedis USNM 41457]|uniref:Uncharacterized protein n=1 Tax=Edhazardia aedis (strain USNM 41457) TaxID=1003232 RepID=J9D8I0_EDHAE|nr:hypothetical protein EDEG_01887 [Edhazardia aedis USNM 41457]|eukprot:EJW03829.1 hypothetical protein EDEG_01887 [Edhazardia aedis USNM 41457]
MFDDCNFECRKKFRKKEKQMKSSKKKKRAVKSINTARNTQNVLENIENCCFNTFLQCGDVTRSRIFFFIRKILLILFVSEISCLRLLKLNDSDKYVMKDSNDELVLETPTKETIEDFYVVIHDRILYWHKKDQYYTIAQSNKSILVKIVEAIVNKKREIGFLEKRKVLDLFNYGIDKEEDEKPELSKPSLKHDIDAMKERAQELSAKLRGSMSDKSKKDTARHKLEETKSEKRRAFSRLRSHSAFEHNLENGFPAENQKQKMKVCVENCDEEPEKLEKIDESERVVEYDEIPDQTR